LPKTTILAACLTKALPFLFKQLMYYIYIFTALQDVI